MPEGFGMENGRPVIYVGNQCECDKLDDDLIQDGYTCYHCYEMDAE